MDDILKRKMILDADVLALGVATVSLEEIAISRES